MKLIKTINQILTIYAIIKAIQHYKKYFPIIIALGKKLYRR